MIPLTEPLMPELGILAMVPDHWGELWQLRHQVLRRLARYFNVLWMNPAYEWRDALAIQKARNVQNTAMTEIPGFTVYNSEFWLPKLYRPKWLAEMTFRQSLRRARTLLLRQGCQQIILYLWRPEFDRALMSVSFDLSCYHIDDEYSFSPVEVPFDETEIRLIATVDQVFIHSPGLLEKKGGINPHTLFVPNGVDYQAYASPVTEPTDLVPIPHPRVGYTGWIKRQLDWSLLFHLTKRHPEWFFVFVGAHSAHPEILDAIQKLSSRPNVHFLGPKSTQDLAAYPQHFDICIMPYVINDYTKYIYPLKLHEYLASGRPTVGPRIRSLEEFVDVVALPNNPDEWSMAITEALSPIANTPKQCEMRQAVAQRYDWESLVLKIAKTMARRLGAEFAERLEKLLRTSI